MAACDKATGFESRFVKLSRSWQFGCTSRNTDKSGAEILFKFFGGWFPSSFRAMAANFIRRKKRSIKMYTGNIRQ